jgi:hypothetical protein
LSDFRFIAGLHAALTRAIVANRGDTPKARIHCAGTPRVVVHDASTVGDQW